MSRLTMRIQRHVKTMISSEVPRTRSLLFEQENGAGQALTEGNLEYTLCTCMRLVTASCTGRAVFAHLGRSGAGGVPGTVANPELVGYRVP
jgi:hypothetical protein